MSRASSSSLKRKRNSKEIQKKRNIKSRKIDKRERKMLVSKRSITMLLSYCMILPISEPFMFFFVLYDCVTVAVTYMTTL